MSRQRKSKSAAWLKRQNKDAHVRLSRRAGYRSRSAYKLLEINAATGVLRTGAAVVDLGAAPGGWAQVIAEKVGDGGVVVAVDILPMAVLPNVRIVCGDFLCTLVRAQIAACLSGRGGRVDLLASDMAPNLTGIAATDQARALALLEGVLEYAPEILMPGGSLVCKAFAGESSDIVHRRMKDCFKRVKICRPQATRAASREMYFVGLGYPGA